MKVDYVNKETYQPFKHIKEGNLFLSESGGLYLKIFPIGVCNAAIVRPAPNCAGAGSAVHFVHDVNVRPVKSITVELE